MIAGILSYFVVYHSGCAKRVPDCRGPKSAPSEQSEIHGPSSSVITAGSAGSHGNENGTISITGLVKHPVHLSVSDLRNYQTTRVRLNDVHQDESFHGVHYYRGVPLKTLLENSRVAKESAVFNRELDLTIVVTNLKGEQVALSWGEIFYRNSSDILIAFEAEPKIPHKACSNCHEAGTYKPWRDMLFRDVSLPKLVAASDFYSDRSLEGVSRIEVVYLGQEKGINLSKKDKPETLNSPEIAVVYKNKRSTIESIDKYKRISAEAIKAGDGTGYHGVLKYSGVSLREVLIDHGLKYDPKEVILLSAPDGYRVILSSAELMAAPSGKQILLADTLNGEALEDGGRFQMVIPHDIPADRWLQAVAEIEILRIEKSPRRDVVGMGSGNTSPVTLEAYSTIARADRGKHLGIIYVGADL